MRPAATCFAPASGSGRIARSFAEKWHLVRAVHRGRAVEEQGHAWLAARFAADMRRRRGPRRGVILFTVGVMALNVVGQLIRGQWIIAAVSAVTLVVVGMSALLFLGSPAQLAAAEEANRVLADQTVRAMDS